ncbi:hypothetical protein COW46_02190 [Candidatus Gracilibacteria bacterium CG17_big_fil_post_rev_8_21_14_2_50_48_13]|nr:MAG: hypothetical protein COW46_02190 [Candidatus Gracilibacteria bacterium CG17_big_fil_post_rev_8_21_14_2_50_48_13]
MGISNQNPVTHRMLSSGPSTAGVSSEEGWKKIKQLVKKSRVHETLFRKGDRDRFEDLKEVQKFLSPKKAVQY